MPPPFPGEYITFTLALFLGVAFFGGEALFLGVDFLKMKKLKKIEAGDDEVMDYAEEITFGVWVHHQILLRWCCHLLRNCRH